jgi:hypothetical protein
VTTELSTEAKLPAHRSGQRHRAAGVDKSVLVEAAITADYDAQSAVERELVLRLSNFLWRLRRATLMETGLFEIQAEHLRGYRRTHQLLQHSQRGIHAVCKRADLANDDSPPQHNHGDIMPADAIKI